MEGKKRNTLIVLVIVILLSIGVIGVLLIEDNKKDREIEGYTGLEKVEEAYLLIENDTNSLYLRSIQCFNHIKNAHFKTINYGFFDIRYDDETGNYSYYVGIEVVFRYGEETLIRRTKISQYSFPNPNFGDSLANIDINKSLVDSENAYDIATNNEKMKEFLRKANKYSYSLSDAGMGYDYNWYFKWIYDDNPRDEGWLTAYIEIDARNGEIVEVSVPGND